MVEELLHQLRISEASLLIVHPDFLDIARLAASAAGISDDRIVFIEKPTRLVPGHTSLEDLIELGTSNGISFSERKFRPGEAKTTLAFLSFSSGTTGITRFLVLLYNHLTHFPRIFRKAKSSPVFVHLMP
jgi:4-coumarate--CoA ligase